MVLLENVNAMNSISWDNASELVRGTLAFAVQMIGELGGIRGVEMLLVIGFILGLLACLYEIKAIER